MQVRVCPKCGTENRASNVSCVSCYASLSGVAKTMSKCEPQLAGSKTSVGYPPQQTGAYAPPPSRPPAAGVYGQPYRERPSQAPKKNGAGWLAAFLVVILLAGGGFAAWKYLLASPPPDQVIKKLSSERVKNLDQARNYFTNDTIAMLAEQAGGEEALDKKIRENSDFDPAEFFKEKPTFKEPVYDGENRATVEMEMPDSVKVQMEQAEKMMGMKIDLKFEMVMLKEEGKWKLDLPQTEERLINQVEAKMQERFGPNFKIPRNALRAK